MIVTQLTRRRSRTRRPPGPQRVTLARAVVSAALAWLTTDARLPVVAALVTVAASAAASSVVFAALTLIA